MSVATTGSLEGEARIVGVFKSLIGLGLDATRMLWRSSSSTPFLFERTQMLSVSHKASDLQHSKPICKWQTVWRIAAERKEPIQYFPIFPSSTSSYMPSPLLILSPELSSEDELDFNDGDTTLFGTPLNFLKKEDLKCADIAPVYEVPAIVDQVKQAPHVLTEVSPDVSDSEYDDKSEGEDVGFEVFHHAGISYTTTGFLGNGGSARVMAADAVDTRSGRKTEVAVKVFCKQASYLLRNRFSSYGVGPKQILAELQMHIRATEIMENGIVPLLAAFEDEKYVYFVMPRFYETLHYRISQEIPERVARFYMACLVKAVEDLQSKCHVAHRDIKPGNILIDKHGRIALADFGLACELEFGDNNQTLLRRDAAGTPYYCAPEVGMNHEARLIRFDGYKPDLSDLWSLGAVMFEIYTGKPYDTDQGFNRRMQELDGMDEAEHLLRWMLSEDPAKRSSLQEIKQHPFFFPLDLDKIDEVEPTHRPLTKVSTGPDGRIEFYTLARNHDISLNNPVTPGEDRFWRRAHIGYHNDEAWDRAFADVDVY